MRWVRHRECQKHRILVEKPHGKRPLGDVGLDEIILK
jgi:hypothetical protein